MRKYILISLVFGLIYFFARFFLAWTHPVSDLATRVSIQVLPGSSLENIIKNLESAKLVDDSWAFYAYVKWHQLETKLQAGEYLIPQNVIYPELVEILQSGKSKEVKITIPEGFTIYQIDQLLTAKNLIKEGYFMQESSSFSLGDIDDSVEGYLFPDTYYVASNTFSAKKLLTRMYREFHRKIGKYRADIPYTRKLDEIVKVASMIEREAFKNSYNEKQKISGIIWKRLDEGIHLGIDATTRYEKNDWKNPLFAQDFENATPYNTRKRLGLPPTAISNPGIDSIRAAIYPIETEYYYYLHDTRGRIHFSKTNAEHNEKKSRYIP